jgi:hypothetical protein
VLPRQKQQTNPLRIIYINTKHLTINSDKGEGEILLPVVTVDDPEDVMNGQKDVYNVRIGANTRVVYDHRGHYRGPRVWIETTEEVIYDETP